MTAMIDSTILVRMNDMAFSTGPARLKTTLGSCVGVILHDPQRKVAGLAHIMLPECLRDDPTPCKYADTAIPLLLEGVVREGAGRGSLRAFLLGGACMFHSAVETKITLIGDRNVEAARKVLGGMKIPIVFTDTGGNQGRTIVFDNQKGEVDVRTVFNPLVAHPAPAAEKPR